MTDPQLSEGKAALITDKQLLELGFQRAFGCCYFFKPLIDWPSLEVVLVVWPAGTASQPHSHGNSFNFSLLLPIGKSKFTVELFNCSRGKLVRSWGKEFTTKVLHVVWPRQIHQIKQLEGISLSLNVYIPRRSR
jgi:hypothetical protein